MNARMEKLPAVVRYRRNVAGPVELKLSCPFCGSAGDGKDGLQTIEVDRDLWAVVCRCCGAIGPTDSRRGAAVGLWNGVAARALGQAVAAVHAGEAA